MRRPARLAAAVLAAGCADRRQVLPPAAPPEFRAGCGDVLRVTFAGRPGWDGTAGVGVDGDLPLGPLGDVPAAQKALPDIQHAAAVAAGLPPEAVGVELVAARAGTVYVRAGRRLRAVPHLGPEPVGGLLRRAGFAVAGPPTITRPDPAGGPPRTFPAGFDTVAEAGDLITVP